MDKTRTLPPLVRGKVTGVLDFFVDEIRLSRNILLLTDNFDLVLQVQWWGEVIPAYIRPKVLHVEGKTKKNSNFVESYYHSVKYDIKTTLGLFKSYLKCCEVVELSVLETFENYIIGSAFLKDLIKLLNYNTELIKMPIFDYLGEEIGEVTVHINFLEKPLQESQNQSKTPLMHKNMYRRKRQENQDFSSSSKIKSCFSLAEKTIFYDGHSKKTEEIFTELPVAKNKCKKKENMTKSGLSVSQNDNDSLGKKNKLIYKSQKYLPETKILSDSSKILYFGVRSRDSTIEDIKNPVNKISSKYNSNSINCKSKPAKKIGRVSSDNSNFQTINQKPESSKNIIKNLVKPQKEQFHCQCSLEVNSFVKLKPQLHLEPDLRSVPPMESSHVKVLDYLLGSDMSKNDEETALNEFKKMSPSQNLVNSIHELCVISSNDSTRSTNKLSINSSPRKSYLNFDFNNPIERNYYEKFFIKSNSSEDFEIAEFLNKPENSIKLNKLESSETSLFKSESESSNLKSLNKFSYLDKQIEKETQRVNEEYLTSQINTNVRNSCARCKYYKKLNELDTIIESLKHFEEKMLLHEKNLQSNLSKNSDVTISRNQFFNDVS